MTYEIVLLTVRHKKNQRLNRALVFLFGVAILCFVRSSDLTKISRRYAYKNPRLWVFGAGGFELGVFAEFLD